MHSAAAFSSTLHSKRPLTHHRSTSPGPSRAAGHTTLAPQVARAIQQINIFLDEELRVLSTQCETPLAGSQQRLSVFQTAARMLQPAVHPTVGDLFGKILHEYDMCLKAIEQETSKESLLRERKKIEEHYHVHYTEVAKAKERDLQQRKEEFQSTESQMISNFRKLENQVMTLREENKQLRKEKLEEHDRMLAMSQAVTESRLAMQRAELAHKEMDIECRKIRAAEKQNFDLLQDHADMMKLLKKNAIPFDARCKFAIDALLGSVK